jgi:hypothetical protein
MKKQVVKALTPIGLLIVMMVMGIGSAQGQSLANDLRVKIPFDFIVGDKELPAGDYSIARVRPSFDNRVLVIESVDNHLTVVRLTSPVESLAPKVEGSLVFRRYGDQYFLSQIWTAGATTGSAFFKSREERELERKAQEQGQVAMKAKAVEIVNLSVDLQ